MNIWRCDNACSFGDQVNCSNLQTTSSGEVKPTSKHFSSYGSNHLRAKIEPPSCWQYKPGNFLAVIPLNWDEMIHENDNDENWADPGGPSGVRSRPGNGNENHDGEDEEDTKGGEKGTGKGRGTKDGKGKGKATEDGKREGKGKGKGKGKAKGNGKGKGIVKQTPGEMISLVPLLCSCRRKCIRQTWTQRAN